MTRNKDKELPLKIMERDLEVLKFIGKGGIASLSQIHTRFWSGAKESTCYQRLHVLKKAGLVRSEMATDHLGKDTLVLLLQPAAYNLFGRAIQDRFFTNITGKSIENWTTEREIKRELAKKQYQNKGKSKSVKTSQVEVADAQALIRDDISGELYEVEVELDGFYYGKMLQGKIDRFAASKKPTIWVTTPDRAEMIASKISNHSNITLFVV
jgi:DNA-binding PadR family transcriptional regulator